MVKTNLAFKLDKETLPLFTRGPFLEQQVEGEHVAIFLQCSDGSGDDDVRYLAGQERIDYALQVEAVVHKLKHGSANPQAYLARAQAVIAEIAANERAKGRKSYGG